MNFICTFQKLKVFIYRKQKNNNYLYKNIHTIMNTYIKLFTNDLKNKGLSLYDKAVYGSLVTKFQYHNNEAFYTYEKYIADELEVSESSVKRSIKKLIELGLISVSKRFNKQLKQTVNYYIINNSILSNENLSNDTSIVSAEKVEQKPNNGQIKASNKERLEQAINDFRIYTNNRGDLIKYFSDWEDLDEGQMEGLCGCLGEISITELTELYNTWRHAA